MVAVRSESGTKSSIDPQSHVRGEFAVKIDGTHYRTIFPAADGDGVMVIDQTKLPFSFELFASARQCKKRPRRSSP